jgi:hypothetical protein
MRLSLFLLNAAATVYQQDFYGICRISSHLQYIRCDINGHVSFSLCHRVRRPPSRHTRACHSMQYDQSCLPSLHSLLSLTAHPPCPLLSLPSSPSPQLSGCWPGTASVRPSEAHHIRRVLPASSTSLLCRSHWPHARCFSSVVICIGQGCKNSQRATEEAIQDSRWEGLGGTDPRPSRWVGQSGTAGP